MSKTTGAGERFDSFVPNMAVPDEFTAPDSTASRPNGATLNDRPRTPNQIPSTAVEADLPKE